MHELVKRTLVELNSIEGLSNICILSNKDKKLIAELEEQHNHGVHECIARGITIMLTHNNKFREPIAPIVKSFNGKHIFPPVPFPEVKHKNVVSSSPGKKVHEFLVNKFNLVVDDEDATLLIGFEL